MTNQEPIAPRTPDAGIRELFTEEARFQSWLDVEAALAQAQAELGIIPEDAAREITRKAQLSLLDLDAIHRGLARTGHPLVPLIWELDRVCEGEAGGYAHWGATTQNITQTGQLMLLRRAHGIFLTQLGRLLRLLADLAEQTRDYALPGRTHGQHAVPATFGLKVAVWIDELLRHVGEGATGIVYKARDSLLHTDIAIKMLRLEYGRSEGALERFRQEIILSRDIGHPNVLRTYHLGEYQNRKYLTMQWVDGQTLAQLIKADGPLNEAVVIDIGMKITAALAAAHARKVLHRDIKPQNILVDRSNEPYLVDFGVARVLGRPGLSANGIFLGTPNYASPEQARLRMLDERSDLYSLGVVLFEMTTGRRPFGGRTSQDVLDQHKSEPAPDPRRLRPSLSTAISAVILRCLEKDAANRFANARALGEALTAIR